MANRRDVIDYEVEVTAEAAIDLDDFAGQLDSQQQRYLLAVLIANMIDQEVADIVLDTIDHDLLKTGESE